MHKQNIYKEYQKLILPDFEIPVEIHHEHRRSARVSLAHQKAIVRIPILCSAVQKEQHITWARNWIYKKLTQDPQARIKYVPKTYQDNTIIRVRNTDFTLNIDYSTVASAASGRRVGTNIKLVIPAGCPPFQQSDLAGKLMSKIMAATYIKGVKTRVEEINQRFFQKKINKVSLRNNSSNWGSCSSSGNISLSTRLLLCPDHIFDYIIVHELAHLVHHNHSSRFWDLVASVMPDYEEAEKWLKKHGEQHRW